MSLSTEVFVAGTEVRNFPSYNGMERLMGRHSFKPVVFQLVDADGREWSARVVEPAARSIHGERQYWWGAVELDEKIVRAVCVTAFPDGSNATYI